MKKVLLISDSFALLARRAAVLAKIASNVTCCNPSEFSRMVGRDNFALVVLCQSLSHDNLLFITSEARRRWPHTRLLHIVDESRQDSAPRQLADAVEAPDPRKLRQTVARMLKNPAGAHVAEATGAAQLRKIA